MRGLRIAALAVALAACGSAKKGSGNSSDGSTQYDSIDVEPAAAQVTVTLGGTASQAYQVFGVIDGAKTDITSSCTLTIDATFGFFTAATATINPHGGKALVTGVCGQQNGTAELEVDLTGTVVGTNAPPGAAGIFGGATAGNNPSLTPTIQYPLDGAVAPLNIPSIETQWAASGNDLFHVALTSQYAAIDVYTTDVQSTLADADWSALAGTAAGGQLTFVVEGLLQATPQTKYASAPVRVTMSHDTIDKSAIYYWAASADSIMSETFGDTGAPTQVIGKCTACHSLSRSGSRIGYSRCVNLNCGSEYAGFMKYDPVAKQWNDVVNADNETIHGSFTTFPPVGYPYADDSKSLAIVSMINGTLSLYDPDTGTAIASNLDTVSLQGSATTRSALMADWSPDGHTILFVATPNANQWIDLDGGQIATMSYTYDPVAQTHTFGTPQFLIKGPISLPGGTYENFFFPSYSADGQLVVFNAARAAWRNFTDEKTAGQRLMLANANASWTVDLTAMNGGTGDSDITWPHWAPGQTTDYYWVAFSSERDYGHEVTAGNTAASCMQNGVKQCKQIWIGAIAKNKLSGTEDPSFAPMWLPGQDTQTDNLSPYWTIPASLVQ